MQYILIVFLSAILFGASTPIGKILLDTLPPFLLAGLLYIGAALGVLPFSIRKQKKTGIQKIGRKNIVRLIGAISFGGVAGPVLLLFGLQMASASSVALWLNLELAATAILGYLFFRDHLGPYGWIGVIGTLGASVILSWHEGSIGTYALFLVGGASVCWGIDNHLTALIDDLTPSQSTFWKGIVAGSLNLLISFFLESTGKEVWMIVFAIIDGVFAYGFSISLYIFAAQNMGATRSQMIFSSAPFFGVILSVLLLGESISRAQIAAAIVLLVSLSILFRDQHSHFHIHEPVNHRHRHKHDDKHHNHEHSKNKDKLWHNHESLSHSHPHWPDIHHRHNHK